MRTTFIVLLAVAGLYSLAVAAPGGIPFPPGPMPEDGNRRTAVMPADKSVLFTQLNPVLTKSAIPLSSTPVEPGNATPTGIPTIGWRSATVNAPWTARYLHASVEYAGKMWVFGGYGHSLCKDVWYSGDGITWTPATQSAPWSGRHGHEVVVFKNKMWLAGGTGNEPLLNDVWYSMDGAN